jgi:hypothetical protein
VQALGVHQDRFAIVGHLALTWSQEQMSEVMHACVIIHNMVIKSRHSDHVARDDQPYDLEVPLIIVDHHIPAAFTDFLAMHQDIYDKAVYHQLQNDL